MRLLPFYVLDVADGAVQGQQSDARSCPRSHETQGQICHVWQRAEADGDMVAVCGGLMDGKKKSRWLYSRQEGAIPTSCGTIPPLLRLATCDLRLAFCVIRDS